MYPSLETFLILSMDHHQILCDWPLGPQMANYPGSSAAKQTTLLLSLFLSLPPSSFTESNIREECSSVHL